jgi:hypothetical protein
MISGFLGTLIALERAVVGPRWSWAAPLLAALGSLTPLLGRPMAGSAFLFLGSAIVLTLFFGDAARRHPDPSFRVLGIGAALWGIGQAVWLVRGTLAAAVPWWTAFLVLTIFGERLELARLIPRGRGMVGLFGAGLAWVLLGLALGEIQPAWGRRALGLGWLILAAWLVRYVAVCMLAGYVWLGIGGALEWLPGEAIAGPLYDARVHALLIGFVFSMIFGHALIIFPAVLRVRLPFSVAFYFPLAVLHLSLLLRLSGDLGGWPDARRVGGLLNGLAILIFLLLIARALRAGLRAE